MGQIAGSNPVNAMLCLDNHKATANENKIEKVKDATVAGSFQSLMTNYGKAGKPNSKASNPFKLALLRQMNKSKTTIQEMFQQRIKKQMDSTTGISIVDTKEMRELDLILKGKSQFNIEEIADSFNINAHVIQDYQRAFS